MTVCLRIYGIMELDVGTACNVFMNSEAL